jgi:chromosomal replication initiator protein
VLDTMYHGSTRITLTVADVQRVVAAYFGISLAELVSGSRAARFAWPRQLAIHLAREMTHASLSSVGTAFGGRNHTTIRYACTRVADRLHADPETAATIEELTESIRQGEVDRRS